VASWRGTVLGGVLALAGLALAGCTPGRAARPDDGALEVRRGDLEPRVLLTGDLAALHSDVLVAPRTSMWELRIRWLEQDGASVKAGQRVLEFDNGAFAGSLEQRRLAESQAANALAERESAVEAQRTDKRFAVEQRKIELEKAESKAEIPEDLLTGREFQENQLALERARAAHAKAAEELAAFERSSAAEIEVLRIALAKARREIAETEHGLAELVLAAPRDGILILGENRREQRKYQVGDSTWPGAPVVELPDLAGMRVDARLSDVDDGRVVPGLPARITLDAFPETTYTGRVESVAAVAQETSFRSTRRAFAVRVALDRSDPERMRPGMSAKVEVLAPAHKGVLLAPRAALDLAGDKPRALLADGTDATIAVGLCSVSDCEVTSGLREGQPLRRRG
jgi:HlyD family secretion protein